ncbi:MAG: peptidase M23 [Bacteroidetes bacterium HGW-Bacteroidetes-4]|jgi:murein DD-endopeptidase MepM/ murein hydrolase activator NlpD|nr:MAG: peptidase M23 [Bacteroidetes bacterium HGW-Bacteroidetes-4]
MRQKYILDTEKLVFRPEEITLKKRLKNIAKYLIAGASLGFLVWGIAFFDAMESPEKIVLEKQNQLLLNNITSINNQFEQIALFIDEVQHRDDNFYRVISQTNPISPSIRQAGFGGVDKYNHLQAFENSEVLIDVLKKGDILLNQLEVQHRSYDTVIHLVINKEDSLLSLPAIAPVAPYDYFRISSPFGRRVHPITKKVHRHDGVDFAARTGKAIYATGNGIVSSVKLSTIGYGNRIVINHGYGYKTLYAHCSKIFVKDGEYVKRGQLIGLVGSTGTSTGPHLHYEVIQNNIKKNPEAFYYNDLNNQEYDEMVKALADTK